MNKPKLVVGITQGDSNGIGYEVLNRVAELDTT